MRLAQTRATTAAILVVVVGIPVALLAAASPAGEARARDDLDCEAFPSQAAAQGELREDPSDPDGLDGPPGRATTGIPGVACEANPAPNDPTSVPGYGDGGQAGGGGVGQHADDGGRDPTTTATVTRVVDGDTVEVRPEIAGTSTVRIIGVDTPEVYGGTERCGAEASAFTKRRLEGKKVRLELDEDRVDTYDRALAHVRYPGDALYGATLIREGLARVLVIPPNDRHEGVLRAAQRRAKAANVGIWGSGPCATSAAGEATLPRGADAGGRPAKGSPDGGRRVIMPDGLPDGLPNTGGPASSPLPAAVMLAGSGLARLGALWGLGRR